MDDRRAASRPTRPCAAAGLSRWEALADPPAPTAPSPPPPPPSPASPACIPVSWRDDALFSRRLEVWCSLLGSQRVCGGSSGFGLSSCRRWAVPFSRRRTLDHTHTRTCAPWLKQPEVWKRLPRDNRGEEAHAAGRRGPTTPNHSRTSRSARKCPSSQSAFRISSPMLSSRFSSVCRSLSVQLENTRTVA